MNHQLKKPQVHKWPQKYKNLSNRKEPIPFNISDIADTAAVDYNNEYKY